MVSIGLVRSQGDQTRALFGITGLVVLVLAATFVVEGARHGVLQLLVVPVVAAAGLLGMRAGIIFAIVLGAIVAFIPSVVSSGEMQTPSRWLLRVLGLVAAAYLVGVLRARLVGLAAARSRFISTVAHELRTPLTSVVGFSESLYERRGELGNNLMVEMVGYLRRDSFYTSHVLDQMILAARIDTESVVMDKDEVDLRASLVQVIENLPPIGNTLNIEMSGEATAIADRPRVRQIFRNLLIHVALSDGGATGMEISATPRAATVTVDYSGGGGLPEDEEHIFAPFYELAREEGAPVSKWLALSVSRQLARLMGGDLTHARDNGGSRLTLTLPVPA